MNNIGVQVMGLLCPEPHLLSDIRQCQFCDILVSLKYAIIGQLTHEDA